MTGNGMVRPCSCPASAYEAMLVPGGFYGTIRPMPGLSAIAHAQAITGTHLEWPKVLWPSRPERAEPAAVTNEPSRYLARGSVAPVTIR
jgi:hypothetical protein